MTKRVIGYILGKVADIESTEGEFCVQPFEDASSEENSNNLAHVWRILLLRALEAMEPGQWLVEQHPSDGTVHIRYKGKRTSKDVMSLLSNTSGVDFSVELDPSKE